MKNPECRLLVRTLLLGQRFIGGEYNRREFARNMTEIFLDEDQIAIGCLRDYVQQQLSIDPESIHCLDLNEYEVLEDIQFILDKVVLPGQKPRAMTPEEIAQELSESNPV